MCAHVCACARARVFDCACVRVCAQIGYQQNDWRCKEKTTMAASGANTLTHIHTHTHAHIKCTLEVEL